MKRHRRQSGQDANACWLDAHDAQMLLKRSLAPPWPAGIISVATEQATWKRWTTTAQHWEHDLLWLPWLAGKVCIHRFVPRSTALSEGELQHLADYAARSAATDDANSVSVVGGGYQSGDRELLESSAELRRSAVPQLISQAVHLAAKAEAAQLARDSLPTELCEAWLNVLGPDGSFNILHTHAGCTYSGVFFVADGGTGVDGGSGKKVAGGRGESDDPEGSCTAHPLSGRLAFFAGTDELLSANHVVMPSLASQYPHVLTAQSSGGPTACMEPCAPNGQHCCLLLRPVPGTCVIFPSFIPHFVIPIAQPTLSPVAQLHPASGAGAEASSRRLRISIAFNFGACEPVLTQLFVQGGGGGDAPETLRVRLVLETVRGICGV